MHLSENRILTIYVLTFVPKIAERTKIECKQ